MKLTIRRYLANLAEHYNPAPARSTIERYCREGRAKDLPDVRAATYEMGRWWLVVQNDLSATDNAA